MMPRSRWLALLAIAVVVLAAAAAYGVTSFIHYQQRQAARSSVDLVASTAAPEGPRVVFRNTAPGQGYGLVAAVALEDPAGARTVSGLACDRVYQTERNGVCLRTNRGIVTSFDAVLTDASGKEVDAWPLPGVPSRTRISADSSLVASTSFITGMSYATVGFSTQTVIRGTDGRDFGNLEDFTTLIDGQNLTAADLNFWGVTFGADDNEFYATAASGAKTWLVRGDLSARTMTSVRENAECPSLSPDGLKVAYKSKVPAGSSWRWAIAVLDLATGRESMVGENRNVDDQVEWLDNSTVLYGLARMNAPGDSDVWSASIDGNSVPTVFIPHAWSPSVIR
jgi:hypothetical protein